jgi:hypothetical protein
MTRAPGEQTRWAVVEVRVWEVEGPTSEAEAIAEVRGQPDLQPVSQATSAEPVDRSAE